ncbi:30S ribosomal protein S17 [Candidatus Saganbacteria bacterium]|nr:30S ribosomal protein S17 [Candidatus Saganbacteria bacterium]
MEKGTRRVKEGVVLSRKMDKTSVVQVERVFAHPKYKKTIKVMKKFLVHDENNEANVGDLVQIIETRPISKRKFHRILKIVGKVKLRLKDLPKKSSSGKKEEIKSDTASN